MSKHESFLCDQCEAESDAPMVYRLAQLTEDSDDDGNQVVDTFDFCTTRCLQTWSTDMAFDFPDVVDAEI